MSQAYDLRDAIEHLESLDGEGTELVTITVPPDKSISHIRDRIAQEYAGAENIKSDQTRNRVQQALVRTQRVLRTYPETPEHGLVVYSGVVDGDLTSYVFDDLPTSVRESSYECADHFDLSALLDSIAPSETFGLIVVERGSAAIGRLVGERILRVRTFESQVMGKSRAGGQSAQRFERERERQEHEFFQKVGQVASEIFIGDGDSVTGVAIGGTLATAKKFVSNNYMDHRLRERVLGTFSVEYANKQGLQQLVEKAEDQLLDAEQQEVREHLAEFHTRLREEDNVAYGSDDVEKAAEFGAVDTGLISSAIPRERRKEYEEMITHQGGEFHIVSTDSEQGKLFADAFGGVGALLRFSIK